MELSFSKLAMVGIVLVALAIVSTAFIRAYSQYSEAHTYISRLSSKASSKSIAVVSCYTNTTYRLSGGNLIPDHNYTAIHFYNYGDWVYTDRISVFYSETGENLTIYYNGTKYSEANGTVMSFPAKELVEVDVNLTDLPSVSSYPSEDYYLVIMWLESGDVEVVRCYSP